MLGHNHKSKHIYDLRTLRLTWKASLTLHCSRGSDSKNAIYSKKEVNNALWRLHPVKECEWWLYVKNAYYQVSPYQCMDLQPYAMETEL